MNVMQKAKVTTCIDAPNVDVIIVAKNTTFLTSARTAVVTTEVGKVTKELAIKILSTRDRYGCLCGWTSGYTEALDMAVEALNERPKGEWVCSDDSYENAVCSNCGFDSGESYVVVKYEQKWKACPMCGARMKGADDEL